MSNYFSVFLLCVLLSQVLSAPFIENNNQNIETAHENDVKPDTPLVRTIRQSGQGKPSGKSGKPSGKTPLPPSKPAPTQARDETNEEGREADQVKVESEVRNVAAIQQGIEQFNGNQQAFRQNQQEIQGFNGNQPVFRANENADINNMNAGFAQLGLQGINQNGNADMSARFAQDVELRNAATYQQDLLSQESQQQARTSHLLDKLKGHPLLNKLKPEYSSYGGSTYDFGSYQPQTEYISYQQPQIQPIVHEKPVLFHQEVIKPIVHEIVKPLPVYHETVKPIVHEVVRPMPIVKEIVKPVPVVHEILKPYSVPVVHPVQFHHQPTQINVPMQWSCKLVPGAGGPAISGIQNGYGSYGSSLSSGIGSYGSSLSSGIGSYGSSLSSGIGSYGSSLSSGIGSYGSYGGSVGLGLGGGLGHGGSAIGLSGGLGHGYGSHGGSNLGTYSLPIQSLPPKFIGHHFKSSEGRDNMQDAIEDMIQQEELQYSSMGPSDMGFQNEDDSQLFAKFDKNKGSNLKPTNQQAQQSSSPMRPVSMTSQAMRPQGLSNQQIRMAQNALERSMQMNSWGQMKSAENDIPTIRAVEMEDQQIPLEQMRSAEMGMQPIFRSVPLEELRSAQMGMQQIPIEGLRFARMGMQEIPLEQMRSAEMGMQQGFRSVPLEQMRSAQIGIPQGMKSAEMERQQGFRSIPLDQIRAAQMGIPQGMRSAEMERQQGFRSIPFDQIRAAQMGIPQEMRSAQMGLQQIPMEGMRSAEMGIQQTPMEGFRSSDIEMQQSPIEAMRAAEIETQESSQLRNAEANNIQELTQS